MKELFKVFFKKPSKEPFKEPFKESFKQPFQKKMIQKKLFPDWNEENSLKMKSILLPLIEFYNNLKYSLVK